MINEVMTGITDAINEEFGDNIEIYKESSMQDMEEPAFFVRCITPDIMKQLGDRRKMDLLFVIQYFPESVKPKQEINEVFERLSIRLDLITVDGKRVRGTVECKDISDNVLTATAQYTLFLNRREPENCMEDYEMKGEIKDANNSN